MAVTWNDIVKACRRRSTLPSAGTLAGTELISVEKTDGKLYKTTVGALGVEGGGGGAVSSVNGEIGAVVLDAADIAETSTRKWLSDTERTKLTGIEASATADQTASEIAALYEGFDDVQRFTDADRTKLDGISPGANVTNNATVAAAGALMTATAGALASQNSVTQKLFERYTILGDLVVGAGVVPLSIRVAGTITNVAVELATAPTGSSAIFDVNKNGTTIFTTQSARPTVNAGSTEDLTSAPAVTSVVAGDTLTVDVDQIGSSVAGANAVVTVEITTSIS